MIRHIRHHLKTLSELNVRRITRANESFLLSNKIVPNLNFTIRTKKTETGSALFKPVTVQLSSDDINVGAEITGTAIDKAELLKILNKFSSKRETRLMCIENGLDSEFLRLRSNVVLFVQLVCSCFRSYSVASIRQLPKALSGNLKSSSRSSCNLQRHSTRSWTRRRHIPLLLEACKTGFPSYRLHGRFETNIRPKATSELVSGSESNKPENNFPFWTNKLGQDVSCNGEISNR